MNKNVKHLYNIASKPSRTIIGLMSGTSLDGLDVALCNITGNGFSTKITIKEYTTVNYDDDFKKEIKTVFSKEEVNLQKICLLNEWIAKKHAAMINKCLLDWKVNSTNIDLIASHGQTIYHAPLSLHGIEKFGNGTLQIGDGDHLAINTGIITISDFRQKHIAAGGEGAPLSAYGDYLIFKEENCDVVLLNIGGISNITFLPGKQQTHLMFSSDIGPGNTLMDGWMQQILPGIFYDNDAAVARRGTINEVLLKNLLANDFLKAALPKSTGPELFNQRYLETAIENSAMFEITAEDIMATLNRFTAQTIVDAIKPLIKFNALKIYVSGGGMHNPMIMDYLKSKLIGATFHSTNEKNINPDAKEAVLFAILANECVAGEIETFIKGLKNFPQVSMGKISFPT